MQITRRRIVLALRLVLATVALVTAAILIYRALATSLDRDQKVLARAVMVVSGCVAGVIAYAGSERLSLPASIRTWLDHHAEIKLIGAFFAAAYAMFAVAQMFAPQNVIEARPGEFGRKLDAIQKQTAPQPVRRAKILDHIGGIWGEPGCHVRFRIRVVDDRAILMESVAEPAGYVRWASRAMIADASDTKMLTVVESLSDPDNGEATRFSYQNNSVAEQLLWQPVRSSVPTILERCR